jgi:hypothetical protein
MQTLTTADYYEAGYYICLGFTVQKVEIVKEDRKPVGKFTFTGEGLTQAQIDYFNGLAVVNLLSFRRAYIHLIALLGNIKRDATRSTGSGTVAPESN